MKDLLEFLRVALESPVNTLLTIFLFIAAIKGTYEIVKWIKGELNTWYQNKQKADKKDESLEQRVSMLEKENAKQDEEYAHINDMMQKMNAALELMAQEEKANTVALCRSQLWTMYGKLKDKDTLTTEEYETFTDLADRYLKNGGNSVFKDKIIPHIKSIAVED